MSSYYNECDTCGANLDPGEQCDCEDAKTKPVKNILELSAKSKAVVIEKNDAQQSA